MDPDYFAEVERLVALMRKVWEEHHPPQGDVHWLIAYYPTFAQIAAAVIADRRSETAKASAQ